MENKMTIANKKELTTEKEYNGYVKVTRIYSLGFESPNDAQAIIDLKTIIPNEIFKDDFDEQTISIIEIKRKFEPEIVVVKDTK
jgi:hypothetical protein